MSVPLVAVDHDEAEPEPTLPALPAALSGGEGWRGWDASGRASASSVRVLALPRREQNDVVRDDDGLAA